jgi:putative membrane protein
MESKIGFVLATLNASLNGTSAVLLLLGRSAIAAKRPQVHRRFMVAAFTVSAIFLCSYLTRIFISGTHNYPGHGVMKALYFTVLFSHMTLAAAVPYLAIRSIYLAWRRRFEEHRRIVRFTYPVWLYVSVTGVVVYLMLYHLA